MFTLSKKNTMCPKNIIISLKDFLEYFFLRRDSGPFGVFYKKNRHAISVTVHILNAVGLTEHTEINLRYCAG